ncbi:uncharacterized protein TNCV_2540931 [Trichonephila clavipes]|nr:uncharacterized protein TNCV_2540931 [Trichonephila clavipes]
MDKVTDHGRHVTCSSPVPLKTCRVGERCTLNLPRAQTSSSWCGVVVRRGGCQLRCRPRHLIMFQNCECHLFKLFFLEDRVNINVALLSYTRSFGDGPRNFDHGQVTWTTHELAPPSPNYHTTPEGGRFSSRQI